MANKFPVRAAIGTKNAFMTVRYLLTRDFLPCFYFVQENVVNHNLDALREKYASFPAINLCNRVTYLLTQTCLSKMKFSNQI